MKTQLLFGGYGNRERSYACSWSDSFPGAGSWSSGGPGYRQERGKFPVPRLDGKKVLLVDDSVDNLKLFQRVLEGAGAIVELAENGEVAVRKQENSPFDAIIMDIRMPVLDGYQATRLIRKQGYRGPVIALTAHATPGEEERCLSAGCSHFCLKPIDRLGLLRAVSSALEEKAG